MDFLRLRWVIAALIITIFAPLLWLVPSRHLFTLLDAVGVSVGIVVIFAYLKGAYIGVRDGVSTAAHMLILGIAIAWMGVVGRLSWLWAWRLAGRPDAMMDHPFIAVTLYMLILGGSFHLIANKAIDNRVPTSGWVKLAVAILSGLALGLGLIFWTEMPHP